MENSSSHTSFPDESENRLRLARDYLVLFLYLVVAVLSIFGNLFVVWVIRKRDKLRKSKTFLILANMAVSGRSIWAISPETLQGFELKQIN